MRLLNSCPGRKPRTATLPSSIIRKHLTLIVGYPNLKNKRSSLHQKLRPRQKPPLPGFSTSKTSFKSSNRRFSKRSRNVKTPWPRLWPILPMATSRTSPLTKIATPGNLRTTWMRISCSRSCPKRSLRSLTK